MAEIRPRQPDVTQLLRDWKDGRRDALDHLLPVVYDELRHMARSQLAHENRHHTLQATDLVHQAFIRLVDQKTDWQSRLHFYGIAATCMRRVLVDHARRKLASKRPPPSAAVELDDVEVSVASPLDTVIAVDEALVALARIDGRQAQIAELKFFAGLKMPEIAEILQISEATIGREWASAKQTLHRLLNGTTHDAR